MRQFIFKGCPEFKENLNSAKALMSGIRKKLRLIGDKGVYEPLKAQNR
jgi:hypothetical protein